MYLDENPELLMNVNWDRFLDLTKHHRVYPLVYIQMEKKSNSLMLPNYVKQELRDLYTKNMFKMLELTAELGRICRVFNENNIRLLVLKGPVLANFLYGDVSKRTSKDLDILIPINDLEKVEEMLYSLGYHLDRNLPMILNNWKKKIHHLSFIHPKKCIQVEVHIRLSSEMGKVPDFGVLWNRKQTSDLAGNPIYFLGNEDLFYYLVSHGARHAWFRLRWLVDIDRVISKEFDFNYLLETSKKYGAMKINGQTLLLLTEFFHVKVNSQFNEVISDKIINKKLSQKSIYFIEKGFIPHSEKNTADFRRHYNNYLFSIRTFRQNLYTIPTKIYPSYKDAETLPLPKFLHFLYCPLRPFLWAYRKFKKINKSVVKD
ncbi:nucleotidyltransferase domain-containing protein [Aquibacillus rhizosphaerae]|uniref:Nucleotidyltransferase family protein n=1 Tax=Aquibacillus rhizosphaerae TaxID=3051431 RepID=A0ABT7L1G0_9BACI|nr:nucleotidyltransferase family protein [Aquibacillus sp. LR5S19]MDL4838970.1 nucleotidyltransferase family protein [Aquibacillus sp. LR5S19]